jgi:hypothetical protein
MRKDLEGSCCGLIEVPSQYLPEGTEEKHETAQDIPCSDCDCSRPPPGHTTTRICTVSESSYGNAELFRETGLGRRGGTVLVNKHTAKKTPSTLTK